ncbi:MAG: radical SAM protein, partial [Propylenella sp.]
MGSRNKRFAVTLIKPSRYDSDGYVIQWRMSAVPSNSLACLYALTRDCSRRQVLGPDVEIEYKAFDEPNTIIPVKKLIRDMEAADGGLVCLVGVQSNQFPRAMH